MKKIQKILLSGFVFLTVFSLVQIAYARISNYSDDEVTTSAMTEDGVMVRLTLPANDSATSTVLVDLSDNLNFRHGPSSGSVDISKIRVSNYALSNATTTIKFGVIASTSPSGNVADIYWFDDVSFTTDGNRANSVDLIQDKTIDYFPSLLKTRISSATSSSFVSNDLTRSASYFATTTKYTSPRGINSVNPAVGDVVMRVYDQKGTATTTVDLFYRVTR